jgi:hypothetical protein
MRRRTPLVRFLALLWATLQLASPAVGAVADGRAVSGGAADLTAHVEATTTSACPVVHAPDCAVCRYLSASAAEPVPEPVQRVVERAAQCPETLRNSARASAHVLPDGRAPPGL